MFTFSLSISYIRYLGISTCLHFSCLFQHSIFGDIHMCTFLLSISAFDIRGFPYAGIYGMYGGGGYLAHFEVNRVVSLSHLQELFDYLWIDRRTRAVFLEFVVVNPATNVFVSNRFSMEFPATGGVVKSCNIYPFRLGLHTGSEGLFMLLCEVLFIVLLIVLLVNICIRVYEQRWDYFRQFWSMVDIIVFCLGIVAVVTYMLRYFLAQETLSKFTKNVQFYVNFDHVVWWDDVFSTIVAAICFLVTLKFILVLQEVKTVRAIVQIFERSRRDLVWNGTSFLLTLIGFALLASLLFGSSLQSYNGILNSMSTLFIALIGKSKFREINDTSPILAKIFFFVFALVSVFFFMTIFMSVLGSTIDEVIKHNRKYMNEDLVQYLLATVKGFIGPKGKKHTPEKSSKQQRFSK